MEQRNTPHFLLSYLLHLSSVSGSGLLWPITYNKSATLRPPQLCHKRPCCLPFSAGHLQLEPGGASGKEPTCQCRRRKRCRFNPWVGRSPGGGLSNLLQFSCLENPTDRGAWRVTDHGGPTGSNTTKQLSTRTHGRLRSPSWRRQWHPLQYPCLENPTDGEA